MTTPIKYRMLKIGEPIKKGDEFKVDRIGFTGWLKAKPSINHNVGDQGISLIYRRPIKKGKK